MGLSCCVPGCNHKNGRELCSLYNFPNENDGPDWKQWYELWCERIGKSQREGGGGVWTPTTWSRVCSCHFKEEERWKPRTRQPGTGLKFRAPVYFPFMSGASGSRTKSEPMNKTPLLAGLRVDTGMKSSLLAGLNVKILNPDKTSEELKSENQETVSAASNGQKCEDNSTEGRRKDDAKRESPDPSESSAKKSKTEDDDDVEMIEDDEDNVSDGIKKGLGVKMRRKSQEDDVQMIDFDEKSKAVEKSFAEAQRAILMKAASKSNSPAMQMVHSSSASNSPVPMNMTTQSMGNSASAYSSLVQMNAKSQIPGNRVLSLTNRTVAPQSKYAELLAVIEDMGRDIRPTYSGSRTATERLKRGIVHARALVRECLAETERSARS
ncbi:uncharacterized protein LOC117290514 isoform X1 [Asterias rubens]|uniref:uncharacterized protein LOC117290514 isoform X1 n=1 Tax=Asterias rubens TaxID=7604 RepID=UPI0014550EAE|nr:uncharacterized protein LOC117290514 isoform X1 [Asterias rubens]